MEYQISPINKDYIEWIIVIIIQVMILYNQFY